MIKLFQEGVNSFRAGRNAYRAGSSGDVLRETGRLAMLAYSYGQHNKTKAEELNEQIFLSNKELFLRILGSAKGLNKTSLQLCEQYSVGMRSGNISAVSFYPNKNIDKNDSYLQYSAFYRTTKPSQEGDLDKSIFYLGGQTIRLRLEDLHSSSKLNATMDSLLIETKSKVNPSNNQIEVLGSTLSFGLGGLETNPFSGLHSSLYQLKLDINPDGVLSAAQLNSFDINKPSFQVKGGEVMFTNVAETLDKILLNAHSINSILGDIRNTTTVPIEHN